MSEYDAPTNSWQLATELLVQSFEDLSIKDLIAAREVCVRWRNVVDYMTEDENMWLKHCEQDFNVLYKVARKKSNSCRLWFDIYQSLKLWNHVPKATEVIELFFESTAISDDIKDLVILRSGVVSIHTRSAVIYYDIATKEEIERDPVYGDFLRFIEFDDAIVILGNHLHLRIIKKAKRGRKSLVKSDSNSDGEIEQDEERIFYHTKYLLNVDRNIYFMNYYDEIYHCDLDKGLKATRLFHDFDEDIMTLSIYNNRLHVLLKFCHVYVHEQKKFKRLCNLAYKKRRIFHYLWQYQFLETLDWREFYLWAASLKLPLAEGPLNNICLVRVYGDTFFIGSDSAKLYMYHKPYVNGFLNLYKSTPVKIFKFMESELLAVFTASSILAIDVMEMKGGHKILVALPKKVMVITYIHNVDKSKAEAAAVQCFPISSSSK